MCTYVCLCLRCPPQIRHVQQTGGAVASPFECWLVLRGLRSLGARMRIHCENAMAVRQCFQSGPITVRWHISLRGVR